MHSVSYGEDYEYAATRLSGTVVRLNNQPVFIKDIDHVSGDAYYLDNSAGKVQKCHLKELDLTPIPLGYVNVGRYTGYVQRVPSRSYKQGLHGNSLFCKDLHVDLISEGLFNTVRGIFPKTLEAVELLMCGEAEEKAFSRRFSISTGPKNSFKLNYGGNTVGTVALNFGAMNLNYSFADKFKFLQETLEEDIQNG
jgi:hypothetical protein